MRSVPDTSVLIGPRVDRLDGELSISAACLAELHFGILVALTEPVRAQRLRRLASSPDRKRSWSPDHLESPESGHGAMIVGDGAALWR